MIVSGIAASHRADLGGYILLAGAIDTASRPPIRLEHGSREVGHVTAMLYVNHDLHITAEIEDDPELLKFDYFSVAGRPLQREQHGNFYRVGRFRLDEISLVKTPANPHCQVLKRRPSDPFRGLARTRCHQIDLFKQAFEAFAKVLPQLMVQK